MKSTILLISCEHAVNTLPKDYHYLFKHHESVLTSRKAMDVGALEITRHLSNALGCEYTQSTVTRLLIDCNRSTDHFRCFSKYTRSLSKQEKQHLIDQYYTPFRQQTKDLIDTHITLGQQVLHLSVHTFKPLFHGLKRNAGIGLLYNPRRHGEKEVARLWGSLLMQETPAYRIRMNYPYLGSTFNFPSCLRKLYPETDYLGIELEINQAILENGALLNEVATMLSHSLSELMQLL